MTFCTWLITNIVGIVSVIVSGIIAYHVYFLSRKIDLKDQLSHRDAVRKQVEQILYHIRNGTSSKVEVINVKKYPEHYLQSNEMTKDGYTYIGAELKALCFDGVEFFCGVRELYKKPDGSFSLKASNGAVRQEVNALEAGVIPYEWIDYIDTRGDEFSYRPQFFVKFKGMKKYPYKRLSYYIHSDTYHEGSDPMDFKWKNIDVEK